MSETMNQEKNCAQSKSSNSEGNALTVQPSGFGLAESLEMLQLAMQEECAGMEFSLDRVKIPAGGITSFEIPAGEETETVKELDCVILLSHPSNTYYREAYKGSSNPPDCSSSDGIHGVGDPGGDCRLCPLNQFGTGGGRAKACKNKRILYILRENEIFPLMLILPPGSLRSFSKYVQTVLTRGRRPHQVVTRITLKKTRHDDTPEFSQAVFSCLRPLAEEEQRNIDAVTAQVRIFASNQEHAMQPVDVDDNPFEEE